MPFEIGAGVGVAVGGGGGKFGSCCAFCSPHSYGVEGVGHERTADAPDSPRDQVLQCTRKSAKGEGARSLSTPPLSLVLVAAAAAAIVAAIVVYSGISTLLLCRRHKRLYRATSGEKTAVTVRKDTKRA